MYLDYSCVLVVRFSCCLLGLYCVVVLLPVIWVLLFALLDFGLVIVLSCFFCFLCIMVYSLVISCFI